jgi:DNA polymerase-3 subunit beta
MKLNLQARLVAAVAQFKASHDIRYYLNGVYVEPRPQGGAVIVATNGHAMGVWLDETGEIERPAILRIGAKLQAACRGSDIKRLTIIDNRLAVLGQKVKGGLKDMELYVQPQPGDWEVPGKFPDWANVVRVIDGPPSLHSALNPEYIAMMDSAIGIGIGDKFKNITVRQEAPHSGIVFTTSATPNFVGVIMPLRDHDAPFPAWVKPMLTRHEMERRAKAAPLPVHEPSDAGPKDSDVRGWAMVTGGAA